MKELFLNTDIRINIKNIEVTDLSAQERFMKLQHGWFQYSRSITHRLSSSFSIQFYMAETVLLRGIEKEILIADGLCPLLKEK